MQALQELGLTNLQAMQLGVTDPASTQTARTTIGAQTPVLDVLVNNAGISGGVAQSTLEATLAQFRTVLETNLFGVAGVTQTFFDLLHHSPQPRIVIVSTAMASLTLYADSANTNVRWLSVYQAPGTALNMCTLNRFTSRAIRPPWLTPCAPATPKATLRAIRAPARPSRSGSAWPSTRC